jgi:hypothetical protein
MHTSVFSAHQHSLGFGGYLGHKGILDDVTYTPGSSLYNTLCSVDLSESNRILGMCSIHPEETQLPPMAFRVGLAKCIGCPSDATESDPDAAKSSQLASRQLVATNIRYKTPRGSLRRASLPTPSGEQCEQHFVLANPPCRPTNTSSPPMRSSASGAICAVTATKTTSSLRSSTSQTISEHTMGRDTKRGQQLKHRMRCRTERRWMRVGRASASWCHGGACRRREKS